MSRQYNDPAGGTPSQIGTQFTTHHYDKRALIEARKEQYFTQLADVTSMPKNMGKKIKKYHYIPLLDDANINDQGLDASGAVIANGNLYGSSKDVGTISAKMPVLSETGGRVNRVGFKRKELEGTFEKFGFFDEYTKDSLNFDSDAELEMHVRREMVNGANEITEDALQIDLLNSAGIVKFAGNATQNNELGEDDLVTYGDLLRLSIDLDNSRTPKHTTIITGTRLVDTKTIPSCRVAYIGSELLPTFKAMKDLHNEPAFISVEKYAAGTTLLNGEVGMVDQFRLVVVPEMMKWAGAGADASSSATSYETADKYDVFPILVVGNESFTTIGFQTDGKSVKFDITHKKPGKETADRNDPYGETGFMSIKWFYGFMLLRPERIALIKTVARM
ncbi:MAG: N4-gp56 family major capsid protein [Anaerolineae bacterium]|nr:N4-gp56 family major capsid protein [Anaerolineae bacterium]